MSLAEFQNQIEEMEKKIREIQIFSEHQGVDLSNELAQMEKKLYDLKQNAYSNLTPWEKVNLARKMERPTALDYIKEVFTEFMEFHGDRYFGDDPAMIGGIARLGNLPITVIGQQKGRNTKENIYRNFGMPHPEGYRKALRLMKQAEKFRRPIICFIDTPGAFCGIAAEERGQGEAIARSLLHMSSLKVPIISIVIGEGGSGGALALGVADKIFMLEHSVYSILSPEGYASILWKDSSKAEAAAAQMKLTAEDLQDFKIIDGILKEPLGGAQENLREMSETIEDILKNEIQILRVQPIEKLLEKRYQKFRNIGI
ncbi:MAG: acetyl-CoA carboxylase carboxyltransferase subunit alpha [Epulopiscium sp.]|nr:acetyl-CoA carboxylase carboxyltransferase subunit alpha [Candidatus Epulonipiscium sp.]